MKVILSNIFNKIPGLRSLKYRIFFIILAVGIVPTMFLRYAILQNYEQRAISVRISDVQAQFKILADHLITYNYLSDTSSEVVNAELAMLAELYDGRVIIIDRNCKIIKDTYAISEGKTIISEEVMLGMRGQTFANYDADNRYIEVITPIVETKPVNETEDDRPEDEKPTENLAKGVMLISVSTDNIATNVDILQSQATTLQVLAMVILIVLAWALARVLVKPFERVTTAIRETKEGYNTEAISVMDYEETEHIITAFNELLGRMRVLDESRQEFVSNVSHELKTPITSMKVLADSLIAQDNVPVELYQEFMVDIADEIERENKIINDLLALVKLDKTSSDMNIENISLNELIELILKRLRPIAKQRSIDVLYESAREVYAEVDEVKLTLALSNFVENAIKYNNEYGYVKVSLDADHQYATIVVEDNGIGIPEEEQEHVFERFYRVDKSHSREIGGTGLGLAIARNAILMHRGSIRIDSEEGAGTQITVRIPLIFVSK